MTKEKYTPFSEHTEKIGKTTFMVTSYGDKTTNQNPEQLIVQLLENKVLNKTSSGTYSKKYGCKSFAYNHI